MLFINFLKSQREQRDRKCSKECEVVKGARVTRVTRVTGLLVSGLVVVLAWTFLMWEDVGAADLQLESERSSFERIPVAVFPFQVRKSASPLGFSPVEVLTNDLNRSQLFRAQNSVKNIDGVVALQGKPPPIALVQRVAMSGVHVSVWAKISRRGGNFLLDAYLFEGDAGRKAFHQRYKTQKKNDVRTMIHRLSNLIIERYSGQKGVAGTKIAFVAEAKHGKQLYVMDYDGHAPRQITFSKEGKLNLFPQWSPAIGKSGKRFLAYTSYRNANPDIRVMDLVTGKREPVVMFEGTNSFPAWSPDGKHLAFAASLKGSSDIYTIQTGEMFTNPKHQRLTVSPANDFSPTWSPDGREIAFASDRMGRGKVQLYVMDSDGANLRRLTWKGKHNSAPAWSPDGQWIAYTCRNDKGKLKICRITPDGHRTVQVTQSDGDHESASWSPDGRHIVFSVANRGKSHIYGVHYDGSGLERLTSGVSRASSPTWGPWN